jgi:hypothetical protein
MLTNLKTITKTGCATCRCIGDPHCISFAKTPASFVVCDVRDANCEFPKGQPLVKKCASLTYMGAQCVMRKDLTGHTFCMFPTTKPPPMMNMYSKQYLDTNNVQQQFQIELTLQVYGSIGEVDITDAGQVYKFGFSFAGHTLSCTVPPNLSSISSKPFSNGKIILDKLPSGVQISMQCIIKSHMWGSRWEVTELADEYVPNDPNRGGFCQTGVIPESDGIPTPCTMDRKILSLFEQWGYRCIGPDATFAPTPPPSDNSGAEAGGWSAYNCKQNWCTKSLLSGIGGINWKYLGFSSVGACQNFVTVGGDNFIKSVCAASPRSSTKDPTQCQNDDGCRDCMDNLKDFPDDALDVLRPQNTAGCNPTSLFENGKANAGKPLLIGGVKILFQAPGTSTFQTIWQATDDDIALFNRQCGCIDFMNQVTEAAFTAPGTYQVQQCYPENQFITGRCTAAPGYALEVDYPTTPVSQDLSIPFGDLVNAGVFVCNAATQCPPNSQCCMWPFQGPGWISCLGNQAQTFPNCGKNLV